MGWLLELLIDGVREVVSQFIVDMMELVTGMFTDLLSCDLSLFEQLFSVVGDLYKNVMVPLGIAILLLICTWQLFKSIFGKAGVNSEDPIELVLRTGICLFFIVAAKPVVNYILNVAGTPYAWVAGTDIKVKSFSEYVSVLEGLTGGLGIDNLSISVLMLIMQFVVAWNYFKMLFVIAERYVLLGVFSYTSPLAFSTGGSKATNNVLASWCKMFGGQVVLIILNAWCLKMFLSGYGNLMASGYGFTKFFIATLCLVGFCKITFKLDSYMSSLGINLGRPSSGVGALGLMMAAGRLFSHVGRGTVSGTSSGGAESGNSGGTYPAGGAAESSGMTGGTGPIPMSQETFGEAMGMEASSDLDSEATHGTPGEQEDFGNADDVNTGNESVLEELGAMPTEDFDTLSMADTPGMDADGAESLTSESVEGSDGADSGRDIMDGGSVETAGGMLGNENGTVGGMEADYPVEEEDFNTEAADGPGMDLESGTIDNAGMEGEAFGKSESSYGEGEIPSQEGAGGTSSDIMSEMGAEPGNSMESYGAGSESGGSVGMSQSGAAVPEEGGADFEAGRIREPDGSVQSLHEGEHFGNEKSYPDSLPAGSIPSSEREYRKTERVEKQIQEIPKNRDDLRKKKGKKSSDDSTPEE